MPVRLFIDHIKSGDAGLIYWSNLCAQFRAGLVDGVVAKQAFTQAANDNVYLRAVLAGKDVPEIAMRALISATDDNLRAIGSILQVSSNLSSVLPPVISTTIDAKVFVKFCIKDTDRFRLKRELIRLITDSGGVAPKIGVSEVDVLHAAWKAGITNLSSPSLAALILPHVTLTTRAPRFWMAGDPAHLPSDPDEVTSHFGLGHVQAGNLLVRLTLRRDRLIELLGSNCAFIRRPGALCVSDKDTPRFRGIAPLEMLASSLNLHGVTVNLDRLARLDANVDGQHEWICPKLTVGSTDVQVQLLGIVTRTPSKPTSREFATYLENTYLITATEEQQVIDALAA